jgi:hypothetical protein
MKLRPGGQPYTRSQSPSGRGLENPLSPLENYSEGNSLYHLSQNLVHALLSQVKLYKLTPLHL